LRRLSLPVELELYYIWTSVCVGMLLPVPRFPLVAAEHKRYNMCMDYLPSTCTNVFFFSLYGSSCICKNSNNNIYQCVVDISCLFLSRLTLVLILRSTLSSLHNLETVRNCCYARNGKGDKRNKEKVNHKTNVAELFFPTWYMLELSLKILSKSTC